MALATAATLLGAVACNDSNVPFLTAPSAGAITTPAGLQNDISGLFEGPRADMGFGISGFMNVVTGFARDGAVFTNTESRTVEYPLGVRPFPTSSGSVWTQEYLNVLQAQQALAAIPNITPAYSAPQKAALTGLIQTLQAYYYMLVAETHDTLGLAILPVGLTATQQAPTVCNMDGWKYIVALLDSANTQLTTAGGIPLPVAVPTGFTGVGSVAGPASAAGSFASFNRALAAKANLELAYAIARTATGGRPSLTSPGSPDIPSLTTALADLTGSALYAPGQLAPESPGPFSAGAYDITLDFSGVSGDVVNPVNSALGTTAVLNDFVADVDTAHDLRWAAHYVSNPNPVQEKLYSDGVASTFIPDMFSTTSAPIPIVREADLVLWHAQIEMGMGAASYPAALADVNLVRATMGGPGLTPYPAGDASTYTTLRDDLMREQRITTAWETSADRTISIRIYGMATVSDTTWEHEDPNFTTDYHTTLEPIPFAELSGRGNSSTFVITEACK